MEMDFVATLLGDVDCALQRQKRHDTPTARRDLVRTLFAAIEGITWLYREHVAGVARDLEVLRPEEEIALSEHLYAVNEDGKIGRQRRYLSITATIRFVTRLASRADRRLVVDFGAEGWAKLREAITIRNRITHPKRARDIEVSEEDISTCLVGFYWLVELATDAMEATTGILRVHTEGARQLLEELKNGDPAAWADYQRARRSLGDDD